MRRVVVSRSWLSRNWLRLTSRLVLRTLIKDKIRASKMKATK